jgi:hypothetical protein
MKWLYMLLISIFASCIQQDYNLSNEEIEQIKREIIKVSEKYARDQVNKDYEEVMKFHGDVDDNFIFGDGYYWGDYSTIDRIWKGFLGGRIKMIKTNLKNHKIHVFSKNAASYLVEYENERVNANGDTIMVSVCFSYRMEKINDKWKAVTAHVSHNIKPGYGFERNHVGYDAINRGKGWWNYHSPEEIEKRIRNKNENSRLRKKTCYPVHTSI